MTSVVTRIVLCCALAAALVIPLASLTGWSSAASEQKLSLLQRETLEPVETVRFGLLPKREGVASEGISGITVGDRNVYLTLEGEPYVLSVKKP